MNIKKETFESRFDRKFACFMKYGIKKIKKINHKKFRRKVKDETREEFDKHDGRRIVEM